MSVAPNGLVSSCGQQGLALVVVCGLLIAVASLVEQELSSCDSRALELGLGSCSTWA